MLRKEPSEALAATLFTSEWETPAAALVVLSRGEASSTLPLPGETNFCWEANHFILRLRTQVDNAEWLRVGRAELVDTLSAQFVHRR